MADKKIPYNKASKQLGYSGPRDRQRRNNMGYGTPDIHMPKIDIDQLKQLLLNDPRIRGELQEDLRVAPPQPKQASVDTKSIEEGVKKAVREEVKGMEGGGLPLEVVQKKIEDAVNHTREQEAKRYKSGLGNLNSQLNEAKAKVKELRREVIDNQQEVNKLRMKTGALEKQIESKDELLANADEKRITEVKVLQDKLTELIEKISSGEFTVQGGRAPGDRPQIEDVFIDPLDELDTDLDAHIEVDAAEAVGYKRDLKSDVAKLKDLLNKKQYKPVKGKSNLLD